MEYKVFYGRTLVELEDNVNEAILEGWHPQGGIAVSCWKVKTANMNKITEWEYCQAMTRLSADKGTE